MVSRPDSDGNYVTFRSVNHYIRSLGPCLAPSYVRENRSPEDEKNGTSEIGRTNPVPPGPVPPNSVQGNETGKSMRKPQGLTKFGQG